MLHASKTPDESGNYNHSVRVYSTPLEIAFFKSQEMERELRMW